MACVLLDHVMFSVYSSLKFNYKDMNVFVGLTDQIVRFGFIIPKHLELETIYTNSCFKDRDTLEGTKLVILPRGADIPTRGSYLKDDDIKEFWLGEPPFLQLHQEDWPSTKNFENYKSKSHCLAKLSNSDIDADVKNMLSFEKYNYFEKLIRITSFVLRFIGNIKLKVKNKTLIIGNLTLDERNRAKRSLIKGAL